MRRLNRDHRAPGAMPPDSSMGYLGQTLRCISDVYLLQQLERFADVRRRIYRSRDAG